MNNYKKFNKKVRITGNLTFETAFHIGSGKEGELATDMGVLRELDGRPILPGSSLKGNFRAFAERLAEYLGLTACLFDSELSGIKCVTDEKYRKSIIDEKKHKSVEDYFKELKSEKKKLDWLDQNTCDICKLFGSPMQTSRIYFSDGELISWGRSLQIRDGVCIDRDTETARHGAKYDFEVVPKGAVFSTSIELENPNDEDFAIVGAALAEWENGFRLGGFTSRGLGKVRFLDKKIDQIDYSDPNQLKTYLIERKMTEADDSLFTDSLELQLALVSEKNKGAQHAEKNDQ
ncbi:CRISPR-associated protein Csm3 [Candidatus Magnetomoraceae bacterium gMMP-15]